MNRDAYHGVGTCFSGGEGPRWYVLHALYVMSTLVHTAEELFQDRLEALKSFCDVLGILVILRLTWYSLCH